MNASRKVVAAAILVLMMVGSITALYLSRLRVVPSISLATTSAAEQGTAITFTVFGLASNGIATIYFGDGHEANTTSTVTYTYPTPGRYLVAAQEFVNGQPVTSTFNALQTIQITPQISLTLAPLISVPVVTFDVTRNPSAPVIRMDDNAYLYGGFLEPPTGTNVTITEYVWDFGNGATKTSSANGTSLKPVDNPTTAMYTQPGLYPVTLKLVTENSTNKTTYVTSVEQTIAVSSSSQPFTVFLYAGSVPNPSVINVAELVAGGQVNLDPNVAIDFLSSETFFNIFSQLLLNNGSSTTNFIPMAAAQIPSVSNGEISPDYTTYTFQIRSGMKFSNGDPLTAYDVWYSMIRTQLFYGGFFYPWVVTILANASDTAEFNALMNAITYSNSSNTVTFKLGSPANPTFFFQDLVGGWGILDSKWLEQVGAGLDFTPASFYAIQSEQPHYTSKVASDSVASGPYMIQSFTPGQSITLSPNPGYPGVPGIPAVHNTVVIQWVKDADTEFNLFRSGQADIAANLLGESNNAQLASTTYVPLVEQEVANGQAALYQFPSLLQSFWSFNLAVNETTMKRDFGSQFHMPSDYFANLDVRKAFAYAFNYTKYIDDIQGNLKYGIDFGDNYAGGIIRGVQYHVPESQLQNVPTYNLTYAKQLLQESGEYNISINIPVLTVGDPNDLTQSPTVQMWAAALHSIDPSIVMTEKHILHSSKEAYLFSGPNPMPIYLGGLVSQPYTPFNVDWLYGQGNPYPSADSWSVQYLNETGHPDEAAMYAEMNSLIQQADSIYASAPSNSTLAAQDYKQVEQIAVNLYIFVYLTTTNQFLLVKPYMTGYQGQISYQENPAWGGTTQFYWWVKGCETPEACTGRNVGP